MSLRRPMLWYELDPAVNNLVLGLEKLPSLYQETFATFIETLSDKFKGVSGTIADSNNQPLSHGAEKVMGLMKNKQRRMNNEECNKLQDAINALYLSSDEIRHAVAVKLNPGLDLLIQYRQACQVTLQKEDPELAKKIVALALANRSEEAKKLIPSVAAVPKTSGVGLGNINLQIKLVDEKLCR